MKPPIDINKKYRYRNGEPARILCVDDFTKPTAPVISINQKNGSVIRHKTTGEFWAANGEHSTNDLIEVREPWRGELWVHDNGTVVNRFGNEGKERFQRPEQWRKITAQEITEGEP